METLCTEFLLYAESRYRRPDGSTTQEPVDYAHAFRHLLNLYRDVAAKDFKIGMLDKVRAAVDPCTAERPRHLWAPCT